MRLLRWIHRKRYGILTVDNRAVSTYPMHEGGQNGNTQHCLHAAKRGATQIGKRFAFRQSVLRQLLQSRLRHYFNGRLPDRRTKAAFRARLRDAASDNLRQAQRSSSEAARTVGSA